MPGVQPIEQCRARATDVQEPGGTRRKTNPDFHPFLLHAVKSFRNVAENPNENVAAASRGFEMGIPLPGEAARERDPSSVPLSRFNPSTPQSPPSLQLKHCSRNMPYPIAPIEIINDQHPVASKQRRPRIA